jgi:hypothetical protein
MSHYAKIDKLQLKDRSCLVAALKEILGLDAKMIEVHTTPVELRDWNGKLNGLKANIVIRKEAFGGRPVNDLGFLKVGNVYEGNVDLTGIHQDFKKALAYTYGKHSAMQKLKGFKMISSQIVNGKMIVTMRQGR